MKKLNIIICILYISMFSKVEAAELQATAADFQLTFENLTLDEFQGEEMGLLGGHLLYARASMPWLRFGMAAYGTVTGERGGFITLGLAADASKAIVDKLSMHYALFVGGGGGHGGYQLQGGGLMLRNAITLEYETGIGAIGLGLSQINFPNGHVNSRQGFVAYRASYNSLIGQGWERPIETEAVQPWLATSSHDFGAIYRAYDVPLGVKNASGGTQFSKVNLVGVEWQHALGERGFISIESEGAMGGESSGYMQILLGAGVKYNYFDAVSLQFSASAGVAGGGNVDTGGGLLVDVGLGLATDIYGTTVGIELAWVDSILASFQARSYAIKIKKAFVLPEVQQNEWVDTASLSAYDIERLRLRTVVQTYMELADGKGAWRNHHANRDVNLLGFKGDYFLNDLFFISGQGIAAYEGQAGGYMTGLLGAGLHYAFTDKWAVEGELLGGAAGGGGLNVGAGLVWQSNAGLSYQWSKAYAVEIQIGHIAAVDGVFAANVATASLAYHYALWMK